MPVNLTSTLDLDLWLGPTLRVSVNPVKAGSTQGGKLNGAIRGVYHKIIYKTEKLEVFKRCYDRRIVQLSHIHMMAF